MQELKESHHRQPRLAAFVQGTRDQGFTSLLTSLPSTRVQQEMTPLPAGFQTQGPLSADTKAEQGWEGERRKGTSLELSRASAIPIATFVHQDLYLSISIGCE